MQYLLLKNRKKVLERYIHYLVTIKTLENEAYTGVLIPRDGEKYAYYILREDEDGIRTKYFQYQQLIEMWVQIKNEWKLVYKRNKTK